MNSPSGLQDRVKPTQPITVVETPEFIRRSEALFGDAERLRIVDVLSIDPEAGDLIRGTGGLRKLRWASSSRGKRGGARIITYFHDRSMPLFLITVFAKNEKSDLSAADRELYRHLAETLRNAYRRRGTS